MMFAQNDEITELGSVGSAASFELELYTCIPVHHPKTSYVFWYLSRAFIQN